MMPTSEELKNMKCRGSKVEKLPSGAHSQRLQWHMNAKVNKALTFFGFRVKQTVKDGSKQT